MSKQRELFPAKGFREKNTPLQAQAAHHLAQPEETPHHALSGSQFGTLPMFMSAREIKRNYSAFDGDREEREHPHTGAYYTESTKSLWKRKYDESFDERTANGYSGTFEPDDLDFNGESTTRNRQRIETDFNDHESLGASILRQGVHKPIFLQTDAGYRQKPEIVGGHHRVAVMAKHKPNELMPVTHEKSIYSAQERPDYR
jgi:hypothetical protein